MTQHKRNRFADTAARTASSTHGNSARSNMQHKQRNERPTSGSNSCITATTQGLAWFWQLAALRLHAISYTIFAAGSWGRQKHPVDLTDRLSAWAVLGAAGRKQLHDWRRGELCRLHHQLLRLLGAVLRDGSMTLHAFTCPCLRLRALSRGDADLAASRS